MLWYASTAWLPFWLVQFYLPGFPQAAQAWQAVFLLVNVFALVALFLHASRTRRGEAGTAPDPAGRALLWAAGAALGACLIALVQQQLYADWNVVLSAGRYLVAAVPASALLFLFAVSTLPPLLLLGRSGKSRGYVAPAALAAILLVFDVYAVSLVRAFYRDNPQQADVQPITTQAAAPR
jgi:hypothetical protein